MRHGIPSLKKLEQAQEYVYRADDSDVIAEKIKYANKALSISAYCADALSLLAQYQADNLFEKKRLYEKAVYAGLAALGIGYFEDDENKKNLWYNIHARPYLRALHGLILTLWEIGENGSRREAISIAEDMLKMNSNDNQGIRMLLFHWYIEDSQYKKARTLLNRYNTDGTADRYYNEALLYFIENKLEDANEVLEAAFKSNVYVPLYFNGQIKMPEELPETISLGGETEAVSYKSIGFSAWKSIQDSLSWLNERFNKGCYSPVPFDEMLKIYHSEAKSYKNLLLIRYTTEGINLILNTSASQLELIKKHSRELRLCVYIENDNIFFAIQVTENYRLEAQISPNELKLYPQMAKDSLNKLACGIGLEIKKIISFYPFCSGKNSDAIKIDIELFGYQNIMIHHYLKKEYQYSTLKDKYGIHYPYNTEEEARVHFIYTLINTSLNNSDPEMIRLIEKKFDINELKNFDYKKLLEVMNYFTNFYKIIPTYTGWTCYKI